MYYKVVDQNLQSIVANVNSSEGRDAIDIINDFTVQYIENKWVRPRKKGTKLMVFDDFHDARYFHSWRGGQIYECKVINPKEVGFLSFFRSLADNYKLLERLVNAREKYSHLQTYCSGCLPPTGTWFCDAIKLTKRIS
ncbi:MAG: hypothetical protein KDD03_13190 [Gelidibacter sp.]|nr:hypothetical protein [Gelidibacter sp.]